MRKVIFGIMFAGMLLAGCATGNTMDAGFDENAAWQSMSDNSP